ncbi:zinc finger protein 568-like [Orussus abietinus]|uniref:zinc finger protein 568-like n=1 Tax=Orussus abietinus TaxID=222816 RepID=UPI000625E660|nr:zinc finger protein 568-like [Orussus abietinus]
MKIKMERKSLPADPEGIDRLCRVCLSRKKNNLSIFRINADDPERSSNLNLSEKLRVCGGIQILKDDGLPDGICFDCISKINLAHKLREQCQWADEKLRKLYGIPIDAHRSDRQKDQWSQTEPFSELEGVKMEHPITSRNKDAVSDIDSNSDTAEKTFSPFPYGKHDELEEKIPLFVVQKKLRVQMKIRRMLMRKEILKTRRISMFKRITSMENLKNSKERQRQFIKKNVNAKHEFLDQNMTPIRNNLRRRPKRESNHRTEPLLECIKCNRSYSSKKSLDRHVLTHKNDKFKCEKCEKQFLRQDKLLEHGKLHESKEKPKSVDCNICNKSFRKLDTMVRHLNVHKKANPKEVFSILKELRERRKQENGEVCSDPEKHSTKDENILKKETRREVEDKSFEKNFPKKVPEISNDSNHNQEAPNSETDISIDTDSFNYVPLYRCQQCTKYYTSEKSLQRHVLIHDEKKYVCNVCNMKFFRQDRLKSHKQRHGHDEYTECTEFEKPADDKSAIKLINSWIREELDSDNEGKGFSCHICGKSYVTRKSLIKHRANAHASPESPCEACGEVCSCNDKKIPDGGSEKAKPFSCDECNKSFEKESKLQKHTRIHERAKEQEDSNFKRFLCHICSKTFRQNTGLMFHMRTHTGYKPHVCKYCGRGFTSNSNCINHERTHTGDRPFVCHFCSAAFAKSCTLKAHITTHTGEANYHCKTCGKSFRRLKYLKEHKFTHTGEKPYACKICGTAYSHSGSLFVHEKKCKAQYSSYQPVPGQTGHDTQNYCQSHTAIVASPVVAPILSNVPPSHRVGNANNVLGVQTNKTYVDNVQRMNTHAVAAATVGSPSLHVHSGDDVSDMASAVRSFAIVGQIFHS